MRCSFVVVLAWIAVASAQPSLLWRTNYDHDATSDYAKFCDVDTSGNVYSAGYSYSNNTDRLLALKHSTSGTLLWAYTYAPSGESAQFRAAALDAGGNLYLCGKVVPQTSSARHIVVVKVLASGISAWTNMVATANVEGNQFYDEAAGMVLDNAGNIYVGSTISNQQVVLTKLAPSGNQLWQQRHDLNPLGDEGLVAMAVQPSTGEIYATVRRGSHGLGDNAFVKFGSKGALEWLREAGEVVGERSQVLISPDAGIYFTLSSQSRPALWKFDNSGTLVWKSVYHGAEEPASDDAVVDLFGNVTLLSENLVIHFNRLGQQEWASRVPDARSGVLAVEHFDQVFFRGKHRNGDFLILARFERNGSQRWTQMTPTPGGIASEGSLVVTNGICSTADSSRGPSNSQDIFVAQYTTNAGPLGPHILTNSPALAGRIGEEITLTVEVEGAGPFQYQWYMGSSTINETTNPSLTFVLSSNSPGTYWVKVSNLSGVTTSGEIPVSTMIPLSDQHVTLNGRAIFDLKMLAPVPGIRWTHNGALLPGQNGSRLELKNVALTNQGTYTVEVPTAEGVHTFSARLFVTDQVEMAWEARYAEPSGPPNSLRMIPDQIGHLAVLSPRYIGHAITMFSTNGLRLNARDSGFQTEFEPARFGADAAGRLYVVTSTMGPNRYLRTRRYSPLATNLMAMRTSASGRNNDASKLLVHNSGVAYILVRSSGPLAVPYTAAAIHAVDMGGDTNQFGNLIWHLHQDGWSPDLYAFDMTFVSSNAIGVSWRYGTTNLLTLVGLDGMVRWTRETPFPAWQVLSTAENELLLAGDQGTVKYNAQGTLLWRNSSPQSFRLAALDRSGRLIVTSSNTIKFDHDGSVLWSSSVTGDHIKTDEHDNVYLSGNLAKSDGSTDLFVAKIRADGVTQWRAVYNGQSDWSEINGGIEVETDGTIYLSAGDDAVNVVKFVERTSAGAPDIAALPPRETAPLGSSMTLGTVMSGVDLTYQWQLDGLAIPGATNATLTITNLQVHHIGGYSVRVTNPYGVAISSETIISPPIGLRSPHVENATDARNFEFTANPGFSYDVQSSTNLSDWSWTHSTFNSIGPVIVRDETPSPGSIFYRVRANR